MKSMDRKLIKLSRNTLVVSLPFEWIKKKGLKKGNEIEIIDKDKELVIRTKSKELKKEKTIDVKEYPNNLLRRTISSAYKIGFDKIRVICKESQIPVIEDYLSEYIGFIIIEKNEKGVILKNVASMEELDFEPILKKTFQILNCFIKEIHEELSQNNIKKIKDFIPHFFNLKKHTRYCMYCLCTEGHKSLKETNIYFYVLATLNAIGDIYYRLCRDIKEDVKINQNTIQYYEKIEQLYDMTYDFFFTSKNLKELYDVRESLVDMKTKKMEEMIATYLTYAARLVREIIECKIMIDMIRKE